MVVHKILALIEIVRFYLPQPMDDFKIYFKQPFKCLGKLSVTIYEKYDSLYLRLESLKRMSICF